VALAAHRLAKTCQNVEGATSKTGLVGRPTESATSRIAHPAGRTRSAARATSRIDHPVGRTRSAARATSTTDHLPAVRAAAGRLVAVVASARAVHPALANYPLRSGVYR
jgi:hypothetical protein